MSLASKQDKKLKREKRKTELKKTAHQRSAAASAPNFGFHEADLLQLKQTVGQLREANNTAFSILDDYNVNIKEKAVHSFNMSQVILKILVDKGIVSESELDEYMKSIQTAEEKLSSTPDGYKAEKGDLLMISFIIFDGDKVVEDRSQQTSAYEVGSGGLPCDEDLIGLMRGEQRHLEVTFKEPFKHKELIGKPLIIALSVHEIQRKAKS